MKHFYLFWFAVGFCRRLDSPFIDIEIVRPANKIDILVHKSDPIF